MKNELKDIYENFGTIEDIIGYDFQDCNLLTQAFTTKAYNKQYNKESLEFVGEASLRFYLNKMLVDTFGYIEDINEDGKMVFGLVEYDTKSKMTKLQNKLLHNSILGYRIEVLGLNKYLLMSKDEIKNFKNEELKEEANLFYSIFGAVVVDSEYNEDLIDEVLENLLNVDYYVVNNFNLEEPDYVTLVLNWNIKTNEEVPYYEFEDSEDGVKSQLIIQTNDGDQIIEGVGYTAAGARRDCAKNVYLFLEKHDLL